jgi:hypothetical protein
MVELDNLTTGQNRYLLLRCRAEEKHKTAAREIARVKVSYLDELDNGRECSFAENVRVAFDPDAAAVRASANPTVIAQRELMLNALKIDEAIAEADAGQLAAAANKLNRQADWLGSQVPNAPAANQGQMNDQIQILRNSAQQLQQGQYGSYTRKGLQSDSWYTRNSKE